jgi:Ca2+-binding RTX toxin-like protein
MAFFSGTQSSDLFDLNTVAFNFGNDDDAVNGLAGDDFIATWRGDDLVVGEGGNDTLDGGAGNDILKGGNGDDFMLDGNGADVVTGGAGNDILLADAGNDVYSGGPGIDGISFGLFLHPGPNAITPNNTIPVTVDLRVTGLQNLGRYGLDRVSGFENVFGGGAGDKFTGTAGPNTLAGNGGNDQLLGLGGGDILSGGAGADRLSPGGPGGARDFLIYGSLSESGVGLATRDQIFAFDKGGQARDDKIDLHLIDARPTVAGNQAFIFKGGAGFSSPFGEVRVTTVAGGTLVSVDNDADPAAEMAILVAGVTGLKGFDFIL